MQARRACVFVQLNASSVTSHSLFLLRCSLLHTVVAHIERLQAVLSKSQSVLHKKLFVPFYLSSLLPCLGFMSCHTIRNFESSAQQQGKLTIRS